MDKQKFLLYMLAGIFTFQASVFVMGLYYCARSGGLDSCPEIGRRYESTFAVMITTTLALLTGKREDKDV